jgi:tetraacyldisaccharide-1-P 4'-kinase
MAVLSVPAHAASDDAIAKEIVFAYQTMCVNGIGKPEKFNATLKKLEDSKTILRLPDDQTKGLFKTKGVAWTTKTESDAELLVTHEANGVCAVRVRESDEDALKDAFEVQVKNVAKEVKGESVKVIDEKKKKSGAGVLVLRSDHQRCADGDGLWYLDRVGEDQDLPAYPDLQSGRP